MTHNEKAQATAVWAFGVCAVGMALIGLSSLVQSFEAVVRAEMNASAAAHARQAAPEHRAWSTTRLLERPSD